MTDFQAARQNMVDCQIRTNGVINPVLIKALGNVPREAFTPETLQSVSYMDEDLMLGDGRFLLEPVTLSRMIEALSPGRDDLVLDVGGATGYAAAILGSLAGTVIALEENKAYLEQAAKVWEALEIGNVVAEQGALAQGCAKHAPYDYILVGGSVADAPEALIKQLREGGRLVTIIRGADQPIGQVTLFESRGDQGYSSVVLFEAGCPYLPGFMPKPAFSF